MNTETTTKRPPVVTDEHLSYLDDLRKSGETNMFGGAVVAVAEEFDIHMNDAQKITLYWMETFGSDTR